MAVMFSFFPLRPAGQPKGVHKTKSTAKITHIRLITSDAMVYSNIRHHKFSFNQIYASIKRNIELFRGQFIG